MCASQPLTFLKDGHSVLAHIHGFVPYFYVAAPRGFTENDLESFARQLDVSNSSHHRKAVTKCYSSKLLMVDPCRTVNL